MYNSSEIGRRHGGGRTLQSD